MKAVAPAPDVAMPQDGAEDGHDVLRVVITVLEVAPVSNEYVERGRAGGGSEIRPATVRPPSEVRHQEEHAEDELKKLYKMQLCLPLDSVGGGGSVAALGRRRGSPKDRENQHGVEAPRSPQRSRQHHHIATKPLPIFGARGSFSQHHN
jgi:hypothetical protein